MPVNICGHIGSGHDDEIIKLEPYVEKKMCHVF